MSKVRFTITEDHLRLLRRAWVSWNDCEFGAPGIDPKRPYGNGDVIHDMSEILGVESVETDDDGDHWPPGTTAKLTKLHRDTEKVLQIALSVGFFEPGVYESEEFKPRTWTKLD